MNRQARWRRALLALLLVTMMVAQGLAPTAYTVAIAAQEDVQMLADQPEETPAATASAEPADKTGDETPEQGAEDPTAEPGDTASDGEIGELPENGGEVAEETDADAAGETEQTEVETTQDAPRAPAAVDALTGVEVSLEGAIATDDGGALLPVAAEITFVWAGREGMGAGDYTAIKLAQTLVGLADDGGELDGGAGTWVLDAAQRTLTITFAEAAAQEGAGGRLKLSADIDMQAMAEQDLTALTFVVEGGRSYDAPLVPIAPIAMFAMMPFSTPKEVLPNYSIQIMQHGVEVGGADQPRITLGTGAAHQVNFRFSYNFPDDESKDVAAGDTTTVGLPDAFPPMTLSGTLDGAGGPYGTWSVSGGVLTLTYNENVTKSNVSGHVDLYFYFDKDDVGNNTEREVEFLVGEGDKRTLQFEPNVSQSVDKEGDIQGKIVTWTVDVNKKLESISGAQVVDTLGAGHTLVPGSFKVYNLTVRMDGSTSQGSEVTDPDIAPNLDGKGFTANLGNIDGAYRIVYQTELDNWDADKVTNNAKLGAYEDDAEVEVEPPQKIAKGGAADRPVNAREIDWVIYVNQDERTLTTPVVTDTLPSGTSLKAGTVKVYQIGGGDVTSSFTIGTPAANKITVTANGEVDYAYRIEYTTDIVGVGENNVKPTTFRNDAVLSHGDDPDVDAYTVITNRRGAPISKSGTLVRPDGDYGARYVEWTINYNTAEELVNGVFTDTIGPGQSLPATAMVYELTGTPTSSGITWTRTLPGRSLAITSADGVNFTLDLKESGSTTDKAYQIVYRTTVTDITATSFANSATGTGVGTGSNTVNNAAPAFSKTAKGIDYVNKTVEWELKIRPLQQPLPGMTIRDTLPAGMLFVEDSDAITPTGTVYTLTPDADLKAFTVTFANPVAGADYVLTFKTRLDYVNTDPAAITKEYTNSVVFNWAGGPEDGVTRTDKVTLKDEFEVNGKKTGSFNKDTGEVTWKIFVNPLSKNLGDVPVVDRMEDNQAVVQGSISVKNGVVAANGDITEGTDVSTPTVSYDADGKGFSLTLSDVTAPYVITYRTEVSGLRQQTYRNIATVKGVQYPGSVDYADYNKYVGKSSAYTRGDQTIDWTVTVNSAKSEIPGARVIDTIGSGHYLDEDSVVVRRAGVVVGEDDYNLIVGKPDLATRTQEFLVELGDIDEEYTIEYKTIITAEGSVTLSNAVRLTGTSIEEDLGGTSQGRDVVMSGGSGSGSGELGILKISKIDAVTRLPINGAEFTLYRSNSAGGRVYIGEGVTSGRGQLIIGDLNYGTYIVEETGVPNGYVMDADPVYGATINSETLDGGEVGLEIENQPTQVTISKVGITGGEELEGATLQILDGETGEVIEEWVSGTAPHLFHAKLTPGKAYTLRETIAPDGYLIAEDMPFTVNADGSAQTVTMQDDWTRVTISKTGITGGEELEGATLQVLDGETGEVVEEWISGTAPHQINAKLIAGKAYRLKEITAPEGYLIAEEIPFTVSTDGRVDGLAMHDDWTKVEISKVWTAAGLPEAALSGAVLRIMDGDAIVMEFTSGDAPQRINARLAPGNYTLVEVSAPDGYILSAPVPFTVSDDGSVDHVKMEDKATDVTISKRTMTGTDELPGATLTLLDAEGNIIKKWVSGKAPTRFVAELLPGASYTLVEEIAPKGYKIAESITFVVNEDGTPQLIVMRDALEESELPKTGDANNLMLWVGVLAGSVAMLVVAVALLKRRRA